MTGVSGPTVHIIKAELWSLCGAFTGSGQGSTSDPLRHRSSYFISAAASLPSPRGGGKHKHPMEAAVTPLTGRVYFTAAPLGGAAALEPFTAQ